jgi:hypothetical protein
MYVGQRVKKPQKGKRHTRKTSCYVGLDGVRLTNTDFVIVVAVGELGLAVGVI